MTGDAASSERRPALAPVKGGTPAKPAAKPPTPPRAAAVAPLAVKSASIAPSAPPASSRPPASVSSSAPPPVASGVVASTAASREPVVIPATPRTGAEHKTVREILPPWHVLQEKLQNKTAAVPTRNEALNQDAQQALQAQEAANAMWSPGPASSPEDSIEVPPSSGVRMSEPGAPAAAAVTSGSAEGPDSLLSFKVYTLAELERRSDAPVSMRASRLNFDVTSSRGTQHWQRAFVALKAFATASLEWLKIKGERPKLTVALRKPFDNLGDELQVAVESVDWKKIGVTTGIVVGATLTLLFAVLTAAELTDDLKPPGSTAHLATAATAATAASGASGDTAGASARTVIDTRGVAPATNMAAMGVQPVEPAPIVIAPPPPAVMAVGEVDELADTPAPVTKKKKAAAKPKTNKLTLRSAPF